MGKYFIKKDDLYVTYVGDGEIHYSKKEPISGIADNIQYVAARLEEMERMGQGVGLIYERIVTKGKNEVFVDDIEYERLEEESYYIIVLDEHSYLADYNQYGEILLSKQRYMKMTSRDVVERVVKALERYGIDKYQLLEVQEKKEMVVV